MARSPQGWSWYASRKLRIQEILPNFRRYRLETVCQNVTAFDNRGTPMGWDAVLREYAGVNRTLMET